MNFRKIITESINQVINENIQFQFSELGKRYNELRNYRARIKRTNLTSSGNQQIIAFVGHEFYNFIAALEISLKRCINSNNINEGTFGNTFSMPNARDFGIELPGSLNNAWYDAKSAYYGIKGKFNRRFGAGNNNNTYNNANANYTGNEKLIYLLTNVWPKIKNDFIKIDGLNNIDRYCPDATKAKNTVEQIIPIVKNIENAQGTTP